MNAFIREREYVRETRFALQYQVTVGTGYLFDCDAKGNVDVDKLPPAARENYEKCLRFSWPKEVLRFDRGYWQPAVIRCGYCQREVVLHSGWANTCECGVEYNGGGQRLAPREQWGEETGERFV